MKIIDWVAGLFSKKKENVVGANDDFDESTMDILKRAEAKFIEASIELNTFDAELIVDHLLQKNGKSMDDEARLQLMTYAKITMDRAMKPVNLLSNDQGMINLGSGVFYRKTKH